MYELAGAEEGAAGPGPGPELCWLLVGGSDEAATGSTCITSGVGAGDVSDRDVRAGGSESASLGASEEDIVGVGSPVVVLLPVGVAVLVVEGAVAVVEVEVVGAVLDVVAVVGVGGVGVGAAAEVTGEVDLVGVSEPDESTISTTPCSVSASCSRSIMVCVVVVLCSDSFSSSASVGGWLEVRMGARL